MDLLKKVRRRYDQYWAVRNSRKGRPTIHAWRPSNWSLSLLGLALLVALAVGTWSGIATVGEAREWRLGFGGVATRTFDPLAPVLLPAMLIAPSYVFFVCWRYGRVQRWYGRRARAHPAERVPTAGSIDGDVVGRNELCGMLMEGLREPDTARPKVLVGNVGTGKTAVLVQLTKMLADNGAVPIVVRLRDAQDTLNFQELAFARFKLEVNERLFSESQADRVWRQLRRENLIVVLADGLEEAFVDPDKVSDRESQIQMAVQQASEQRLPLVIASRHHDPLRALEASITELEPLGEGPALDYLTGEGREAERRQFARLVQTADVADAPIYLQVIRQLEQQDRLRRLTPGQDWLKRMTSDGDQQQSRPIDRIELRLSLLDDWKYSLVNGHLFEDYALKPELREKALTVLSALACVGLSQDRLEVDFEDLVGSSDSTSDGGGGVVGPAPTAAQHKPEHKLKGKPPHRIAAELTDRLSDRSVTLKDCCALAATMGSELGIVESKGTSVRFRHSIIQAYLGTKFLSEALKDGDGYTATALRNGGREFLVAMVMLSRAESDSKSAEDGYHRLRVAAAQGTDSVNALQLFAAVAEIEAYRCEPDAVTNLAQELEPRWKNFGLTDIQDRALLEAKTAMVRQFGLSAQWAAPKARAASSEATQLHGFYQSLFQIAAVEDDYAVKVAAVQAIGDGGDIAFAALNDDHFEEWWGWWCGQWSDRNNRLRQPADNPNARPPDDADMWQRKGVVCAGLAPMLYCSAANGPGEPRVGARPGEPAGTSGEAQLANLKRWIYDYLAKVDPSRPEKRAWITFEVALAQGFRHAANFRPGHTAADARRRTVLIEQAEAALKHSRFWFAQLTLIQALTLLSLPDDPDEPLKNRGHGADPKGSVDYWLRIAGTGFADVEHRSGHQNHPFVREAGALAVDALLTRSPTQYCWIDEAGTVSQVGSLQRPGKLHEHRQWILPSAGWSALVPRAQQLLGDVLLLLNLADRGNTPQQREERLSRADRSDLPPCLTRDRSSLDVTRTVGSAKVSDPGSNCHDSCTFRLCPYPPVGEKEYRAELGEGFCHQLWRKGGRVGYATHMRKSVHRAFWQDMSDRVRPRRHGNTKGQRP
jgi:hypothetical protein